MLSHSQLLYAIDKPSWCSTPQCNHRSSQDHECENHPIQEIRKRTLGKDTRFAEGHSASRPGTHKRRMAHTVGSCEHPGQVHPDRGMDTNSARPKIVLDQQVREAA